MQFWEHFGTILGNFGTILGALGNLGPFWNHFSRPLLKNKNGVGEVHVWKSKTSFGTSNALPARGRG